MTYDLIIRNGTIVDGLGGEPYVGDVAVRDGVITAVGHVNGATAEREIDADRAAGHAGLRRPAHPLRRPGHLVGAVDSVVGARGDHRGDGQLRRRVRAMPPGGPRRARRRDGRRRGHSRRRDDRRTALDVGDLPRIPGRAGGRQARHRRRRLSAAFPAAGLRDGPARRRPRAGHRRGPRQDAGAGQGGDRDRGAGLRIVAADHPQDRKRFSDPELRRRPRGDRRDRPRGGRRAAAGCCSSFPTFRPAATSPCCRRCSTSPRTSDCRSPSRWSSPTPATRRGPTPSPWSRRPTPPAVTSPHSCCPARSG